MSVAIVGGGIAGLTVALRLQQQGIPYTLIGADPVLGGKIRTESVDGFVIEGGPDSFLAEKPWARQLCEEVGLGEEIIGTNDAQRQTFLVSRGRLRPLPEGFLMLMPVKPLALLRSRLISIPGVMRMALEPIIPRRRSDADESIGSFVRRRFGDEVCQRIVDPLMAGIYAGDCDDLSIESTFPRLRNVEREHGSIIRGLLRMSRTVKPAEGAARSSLFLSLRGGIGRLVQAIASRLDTNAIQTGTRVTALIRGELYRLLLSNGSEVLADAVVLTIPSFAAAALVKELDHELAVLLRQIPYVSTATVSLAFRRGDISHPLNGFGFVVPRVERRRITACTWVTTKLPHRAPEDAVVLRCFIGRAGDDDWIGSSDEELVDRSLAELRDLMGVTARPLFARVFRWEKSMPQYRVGHQELLRKIDTRVAAHANLFLSGSAYRGVGLPDVIREATTVSSSVAATLSRVTTSDQ